MSRTALASVVCVLTLGCASANAFLRGQAGDAQTVSASAVEQTLMTELSLMGRDHHLIQLQEQLEPMFAALPKNGQNRLEAPVVRYALHRFFVQTRGWFVQGLKPDGAARDSESAVKIMKDRVPGFIQELLERRVRGQGLELQELAAFAATIQDLVHAEAMQSLLEVLAAHEVSSGASLTAEVADKVVDTYLISYILGRNVSEADAASLGKLRSEVEELYPAWPDVQLWARDVQQTIRLHRGWAANPFASAELSLDAVTHIVQELGHQFGAFQDQECRTMKDALVDLEYRGSGRVRLSDFYKGTLEGNWQFAESTDYLRAIGALDETNPSMPSVLIANYVGSQSNCLASSSFYSVCCLDECESLLGKLEVAVGAPSAKAEQIADLVAAMPSDTVDAPRNLSAALHARLSEIASHHGGRVPLHGRLFAQWMHHAYPRECPFPHLAGSTNPMTPDEWMSSMGDVVASMQDMRKHVAAGGNTSSPALADELEALPWTSIEELVAVHEPAFGTRGRGSWIGAASKVVLLGAFAFLMAPKLNSCMGLLRDSRELDTKLPHYVV